MEQYKIDYDKCTVYVTYKGDWFGWAQLSFKYLEMYPPTYSHLNEDRSNCYAIARDKLIDEGLIEPQKYSKESE